jgi:hypothetical protein
MPDFVRHREKPDAGLHRNDGHFRYLIDRAISVKLNKIPQWLTGSWGGLVEWLPVVLAVTKSNLPSQGNDGEKGHL